MTPAPNTDTGADTDRNASTGANADANTNAETDAEAEANTGTPTGDAAVTTPGSGEHDDRADDHQATDDDRTIGDHADGCGSDRRRSLAALVRDAADRGESEAAIADRVRASYERSVPFGRVKRLVAAERERLDRTDDRPIAEEHPPRYADVEDLASLTDAEFGRVIAYLLAERDGRADVVPDADSGPAGTAEHADDAASTATGDADKGDDGDDGNDGGNTGSGRTQGTSVRWHRGDGIGTVLVRALAAEPDRVVDAGVVSCACERARSRSIGTATGGCGGVADEAGYDRAAIVTVAPVVPGATRLAVRSGTRLYDGSDVRSWLDGAKLSIETFGSLIDDP